MVLRLFLRELIVKFNTKEGKGMDKVKEKKSNAKKMIQSVFNVESLLIAFDYKRHNIK